MRKQMQNLSIYQTAQTYFSHRKSICTFTENISLINGKKN